MQSSTCYQCYMNRECEGQEGPLMRISFALGCDSRLKQILLWSAISSFIKKASKAIDQKQSSRTRVLS
jgi:hypothetical protein